MLCRCCAAADEAADDENGLDMCDVLCCRSSESVFRFVQVWEFSFTASRLLLLLLLLGSGGFGNCLFVCLLFIQGIYAVCLPVAVNVLDAWSLYTMIDTGKGKAVFGFFILESQTRKHIHTLKT